LPTLRRNVSLLLFTAAVAALLCAGGCAVALAPGFQIAKEKREIRFVPGPTPALAIRIGYTLLNTGTTELHSIDVRLPSEKNSGRSDLHVTIDGHETPATPVSPAIRQAEPDTVRINFEKPWSRKQKRELSFEYTLRSPLDSQSYVTIAPASFHLGERGWAPQLQPPKQLLASYPSRPAYMLYSVRVPADFVVLAGGRRRGEKNYGDEIQYRYELGRADLGAFAVAGRYTKWPTNGERNSVVFWTDQPWTGNANKSAQQIQHIWKTFTVDFGGFDARVREPRIVESAAVRYDLAGEPGPAAASFPGGALVNPAALALGIDSDRFLEIVSVALARNWFDEGVNPSADAVIGMGDGLPEYASIVADEARNGPLARRQRIYEYLRRYDATAKQGDETPLAGTTAASPLPQRRIALAKAPLFYIEMEDACGERQVRAGLAHMLASMRGQEVDYNVLRSVLEESTGRDLGKIFREWLYQKGIPQNFRARYPYGEGSKEMGN
jgi:hypothetical protein